MIPPPGLKRSVEATDRVLGGHIMLWTSEAGGSSLQAPLSAPAGGIIRGWDLQIRDVGTITSGFFGAGWLPFRGFRIVAKAIHGSVIARRSAALKRYGRLRSINLHEQIAVGVVNVLYVLYFPASVVSRILAFLIERSTCRSSR